MRPASRRDSRLPVLLTFDDGGASAELIADCLDVFGWQGHFFVTTDYIDRPGFLRASQIRDLRARGHLVGSHSCTHPLRMAHCTKDRMRGEWSRSVVTLSDLLGERVEIASVPGGDYSAAVGDAASQAGVRFLFTSRPSVGTHRQSGTLVLGRFAVRRTIGPGRAAHVAGGGLAPRLPQLVCWDLKRVVKAIGRSGFVMARHRWLNGSPDVRWGDDPSA